MFYSLRARLTVTFIVLLVIPFMTMAIVMTQVSNSIIGTSIEQSTSQTIDQYASFVQALNGQVEDVANQVLSNELTQHWITAQLDPNLPEEQRVSLDAEMRKFLSSIALNHSAISSITIFDDVGTAVGIRDQTFRDPAYLQSDWYLSFKRDGIRWAPAHLDPYQPSYLKGESVNSLIFNLVQLSTFRNIGVLKVNVPTTSIQEAIEKIKFGETGKVFLLDKNGNPVLKQDIPEEMSGFRSVWEEVWNRPGSGGKIDVDWNGDRHLVLYRMLKGSDWVVVGEAPQYELFQKTATVRLTMIGVAAALLLATIGAAFWLSSGIARPLSKLAGAMRHAERGDFNRSETEVLSRMPLQRSEVGYVIKVFLNMVRRLRNLIETEFQANMRRKDAEYKALLMQINPHFLYNTLEVIGSLSLQDRKEDVLDVTESLGQMLRYSLKTDSDLTTVGEEMQYIRHYVTILRIRFGERLRLTVDEDPEIARLSIVRFILQPLVENAVKFSLDNGGPAHVRVWAMRSGPSLEIGVRDNGVGMPAELIEELKREWTQGEMTEVLKTGGRRIGLRNVMARCYLYYGARMDVTIESAPGDGTAIVFKLPQGGG